MGHLNSRTILDPYSLYVFHQKSMFVDRLAAALFMCPSKHAESTAKHHF